MALVCDASFAVRFVVSLIRCGTLRSRAQVNCKCVEHSDRNRCSRTQYGDDGNNNDDTASVTY